MLSARDSMTFTIKQPIVSPPKFVSVLSYTHKLVGVLTKHHWSLWARDLRERFVRLFTPWVKTHVDGKCPCIHEPPRVHKDPRRAGKFRSFIAHHESIITHCGSMGSYGFRWRMAKVKGRSKLNPFPWMVNAILLLPGKITTLTLLDLLVCLCGERERERGGGGGGGGSWAYLE